jgi:hypothetical protein
MEFVNADWAITAFLSYVTVRLAVSCLLASPFGGVFRDAWKQIVSIVNLFACLVLLICFAGLMTAGWSASPLRWLASLAMTLLSNLGKAVNKA